MLSTASHRNSPAKSTRLIVKNNSFQRLEKFRVQKQRPTPPIGANINADQCKSSRRNCVGAALVAALPARQASAHHQGVYARLRRAMGRPYDCAFQTKARRGFAAGLLAHFVSFNFPNTPIRAYASSALRWHAHRPPPGSLKRSRRSCLMRRDRTNGEKHGRPGDHSGAAADEA
jgi:hypothetical protein